MNPNDATFSPCRRYRYELRRSWDHQREPLVVVMLNPSTADEALDDPTIRRVIGFARRDGYGGIRVLNLFALRATDPRELMAVDDPIGPRNDEFLAQYLWAAAGRLPVLAAWGCNGKFVDRDHAVRQMVEGVRWVCLGLTAEGCPRHPLYVRKTQALQVYGGRPA